MAPLFAISVHDIDAGGLARSFELPLPWLEQVLADTDVTAAGPGHADVRLSKTGHDVIVRAKVKATLAQPCARCLRPTTQDVEGELSLLLRPARGEGAHPHAHGHAHAHAGGADRDAKEAGKRAGKEGAHHDRPSQGREARQAAPRNGAARRGNDRAHEEEYEFSSEEADQDVYDGEVVVLDGFLREALLLEMPSFPLCSEDCPGIRPATTVATGRQEGIDPRLSPLRALQSRLKLAPGPEAAGAPPPAGEGPAEAPAPDSAAPRPPRAGMPPRPRIQAHRAAGSIGTRSGSKKSKAKKSPLKKAK